MRAFLADSVTKRVCTPSGMGSLVSSNPENRPWPISHPLTFFAVNEPVKLLTVIYLACYGRRCQSSPLTKKLLANVSLVVLVFLYFFLVFLVVYVVTVLRSLGENPYNIPASRLKWRPIRV